MQTTDILREEHRWILCMLLCLERVTDDSERRGHLDARSASELLSLFTHFADGLHQEREERCLFPRLLARARSVSERTDIGCLCGEHEIERSTMGRMSQELLGAIYGCPQSLRDFQREARRFVLTQRAHLAHENRELLPLAETLLTPEDDQAIAGWFQAMDREEPGEARDILARIEALCGQLGVDPLAESSARWSAQS